MTLIRRLILSLVTAVVFGMPVGKFTGQTQAQSHHYTRYYYVYYRDCPESPWYCYGSYANLYYAEYVVFYLQYYGYETFIR
jgi:hypothetical protein